MRFVDTTGLEDLRGHGTGPWRVGEDELLRTTWRLQPLDTPQMAQRLFDVYAAALGAQVDAPKPLEVVEVPGGYGVLVEYVEGAVLPLHIALGSYTPQEAGAEMGELARRLHGAQASAGCDWNQTFRTWARGLEPLLPEGVGARLVQLVDDIPESHALLHGDLYADNLVVRDGGLALIDMETVGFGHPVLDLAIMRTRALHNGKRVARRKGLGEERANVATHDLWSAALGAYFPQSNADELQLLDQRIAVLCEVERSCFSFDLGLGSPEMFTQTQQTRLANLAESLAVLLPHVDRLWF